MMNIAILPVNQRAAGLTVRGYVRFINVRPDKAHGDWICDECLQRVTVARQPDHASKHGSQRS